MSKEQIEKFNELFQIIDEYFEWEKVYQAMKFLDIQWIINFGEDRGIPSIPTIKKEAKKICFDAYLSTKSSSHKGFVASYKDGILNLEYILTQSTTEGAEL